MARVLRRTLAFVLPLLMATLNAGPALASHDLKVELRAELSGPEIDGEEPRGEAEYSVDPENQTLKASLEVESNLPGGTALSVFFNGEDTGKSIHLTDNGTFKAEFRIESGFIPLKVHEGDVLELRLYDVVVLAGAFEETG